jgi:ring-1,2-phenylacetyl-CoA epoxidase subunit PaaE
MTAEPLAAGGAAGELGRPARHAAFHRLPVGRIDRLTDDAVAITFDVPEDLRSDYAFLPGQHVSVRSTLAGDDVRRNYSICEPSSSGRLRIAVKRLPGGAFSAHALERLHVGDELDVMTPVGRFGPRLDPARRRRYAAIAAGSGITPILSILASVLAIEPASEATLVYGNRTAGSIMFLDEISDLKDRYPERFAVVHVLSREPRDAEMFHGRLDAERIERLLAAGVLPPDSDEWYLCGPPGMIDDARTVLAGHGVDPAQVHRELFHAGPPPPRRPAAPAGPEADVSSDAATVTVILDGLATTFPLRPDGESILEATLRVRADAPFACKGGVCGTCRARLLEGRVEMDQNYALEDDELAAGTVLACQSHPATSRVTLEYGG